MTPTRRRILHWATSAAALATAWPLRAAGYPERAVRVVVPVAAGGANDVTARLICQRLSEHLGQQFFVENRPGAGTNLGTEAVIRSPADGYTLLIAGSNAAINATLFKKLTFNFIRDTAPIGSIVRVPQVMQGFWYLCDAVMLIALRREISVSPGLGCLPAGPCPAGT